MKRKGVLIALAFPEEFVSMIPAWYKKPLEWIGMVKDNKLSAGHAALALVDTSTGIIEYADFGRYITPFGKGRARTVLTDPECEIEIKAIFDSNGKITNEKEILLYLEAHPHKTHGAGRMYGSYCYNVDYEKAKAFITNTNLKGSITYDPFKKHASNCARFVYDTFKAGMISSAKRWKLISRNSLTPSPLGIVFHSTDQDEVYSVLNGQLEDYEGSRFRSVIRHLFTTPNGESDDEEEKEELHETHHWLDGIGDSSWFKLSKPNGKYIFERRKANGEIIFEEEFVPEDREFDINQPYVLIHDCNALWCTVRQNNKIYRLLHKDFESLI